MTNTVLSSLQRFLTYHQGLAPDLIGRWTTQMETQVLTVAGEPIEGRFTNGVDTWWNIRVPKDADSEPHFKDYRIDWPYDDFAEAIGSTGWDWVDRTSRWVGFDFDGITGHAKGVGISDEELDRVRDKALALPYVEVRRSTGGAGLHLYVHVDVPTANHTEHAALARCVLGMMSTDCAFDFAGRVDCCGGNMWIWHKKLLMPGSVGLHLIKASERTLTVADLPVNWRDHIDVVTKKRSKVAVPKGLEDLAQSRQTTPLEPSHRRLIEAVAESGYVCNWLDDHHLLQTKTKALQDIYESQVVPVKGVFSTVSEGDNPAKPNCYMFPLAGGGWRVYRFSQNAGSIIETATWRQDDQGRTWCFYDKRPPLKTACLFHGGVEDSRNGEFRFTSAEKAIAAAASMGQAIDIPFDGREIRLGTSKDGRLVVKLAKDKEEGELHNWIPQRDRYEQTHEVVEDKEERSISDIDNMIRQLISVTGESAGWKIKTGDWRGASKDDVRSKLIADGTPKAKVEEVVGTVINHPWKLVNLPFHQEYPGDRQWNLGAAQFAVEPAEGPHPHWDLIMRHCGRDLDSYIAELAWCKEDRVLSGADYLKAWLACMLRHPFDPLPYLFMFGEENTGKSIFHEAASLLMTSGVVIADRALTNKNDFNGELANAILCVVEEKDISKAPGAMNKIKEWVTGKFISIRKMRMDSYSQPNTTHWVQCANKRQNCPVFPGDTRITFICVHPPERDIPKFQLIESLQAEAPQFLNTLLNLELPKTRGRLRLPVIETQHKTAAADACELRDNPLSAFMRERIVRCEGSLLPVEDVRREFIATLAPEEAAPWNSTRFGRELNELGFPRKTHGGSQTKHLVNVEWATAA